MAAPLTMPRRAVALGLSALFLLTGLAGLVMPCSPEGNARGRITVDGNLTWYDDRRVTNNAADDTDPAIVTDHSGSSYIAYYRQGTHYYVRLDLHGNLFREETTIATAPMPVQHSGQPCERVGIDAFSNLHVVWTTQPVTDPRYQKFASNGNPLTQAMSLGSLGLTPHALGLAAGRNQRAYFAFENGSSKAIEMAFMESNFTIHNGFVAGSSGEGVTIGLDTYDRPHLFWRDRNTGALRMSVFDPDGHLDYDSVPVAEPAGPFGLPMPAVAFTSDGAIHLLQADARAGKRSLYYTRLSQNGSTLSPPKLVTNSSADYGDICADRFQNVYIVWGNTTEGMLSYACVRPGSENATPPARLLAGSSGTNTQPQISSSIDGRIHVIWVSDRDGNREIYYKLGVADGVEITMTPEEMSKVTYLKPNQTKSANVTVRNLGGHNDTAFLGINADFFGKTGGFGRNYTGGGYKLWIDDYYQEINLLPEGIVKVPIYIRAPPNGTPNEYIKVAVNATSMLNPMRHDIVEFRVYLSIDIRLKLDCGEKAKTTEAGVPARYTLSAMNIGEVDIPVAFTAVGPRYWNYSLNLTGAFLRPLESVLVGLDVSPPLDAMGDDTGVVAVTAMHANWTSYSATIKTTTVVTPYMYSVMTPDRNESSVDPGMTADYLLTVSNFGNLAGTVILILEIVSDVQDWSVSLDTYAVAVQGGGNGFAVLRVIPPADAPAGSNLTVWVMCFDAEKRYSADCRVTTLVNQVYGLGTTVSPAQASLDPGGKAIFRVNVRNLANGPDRCMVGTIALPSGWGLTLFGPDGQMTGLEGFDIPYKGAGWFDVVVAAPMNAMTGAYQILGDVTDGGGNRGEYAFTLDVNQVFGVWLEAPAAMISGEPRSRVGFELNITNTGNGVDAFQLAATGLPPGWRKVEFRDMAGAIGDRPDIGPGSTGRMLAFVDVPASTPLNSVRFNVSASSEGGPMSSVVLALSIRKAELAITEVELLSGELDIGRPVMVRLTVRNGGEAPAANVTVTYFRNREPRTTEELGTILPGQERTTTFVWVPVEGKNELDFVVDPKNDICEYDETNNTAVLERVVLRKIGARAEGAPWLMLVAAVPVLLVGLYLVARAARKRKK